MTAERCCKHCGLPIEDVGEEDRCSLAEHSAISEVKNERDIYRAVLESAGYEKLDDLPAKGITFAQALGATARLRTLELKHALEATK